MWQARADMIGNGSDGNPDEHMEWSPPYSPTECGEPPPEQPDQPDQPLHEEQHLVALRPAPANCSRETITAVLNDQLCILGKSPLADVVEHIVSTAMVRSDIKHSGIDELCKQILQRRKFR